uniref:Laminin N-terminal domain-containing protein n=1 Tax=Stegastes partitus TaxID=144197 RepID=A0A3B4YWZ3_9TELE
MFFRLGSEQSSLTHALLHPSGLFPAIFNLASNAVISTNATCGYPKSEDYCKLVEHVPGRTRNNSHCLKCDANSSLSTERHPITNAIDGTNQWWQSPSIKNGRQFHWITITLDLKQRSLDGATFDPWQFYAISDSECLSRYNMTPRLGPPTYQSDTEVICTSYYSRLNPLEHGEIHTSLINGRPGADDLTSDLLNFTSARYIRLRLQRIRTLNADLMTLSARDPRDIDPIVTRRVCDRCVTVLLLHQRRLCGRDVYLLRTRSELPAGPRYQGNTHTCAASPNTCMTQHLHVCECEHNTCGESCDECCPGYHQQPWQPGTISEGNTCESKKHKCLCDLRGSKSSVCSRDDTQPGVSAGQCVCQEGFAGRRCDRCAFGYRDFPRCVHCECNLSGSTNSDPCSTCTCKVNVMGAHCDLCKPGFYNLQDNNPLGCTDCFCFGVSDVCESSAWSTAQVTHTCISYKRSVLQWAAPESFLGNKLVSYGGFLNYSVGYDAPLDNEDRSLPAHCDIVIEVRTSPCLDRRVCCIVGLFADNFCTSTVDRLFSLLHS